MINSEQNSNTSKKIDASFFSIKAKDEQTTPIVLASIMNSLYQQEASVRQIMSQMLSHYPDNRTIYFILGDVIYEATKDALFGKKWTKDPIIKNREKCLKKYNTFKTDRWEMLSWEAFYTYEEYRYFRRFTTAILQKTTLSSTTLERHFPDISAEHLTWLAKEINSSTILDNIPTIAKNHSNKNLKKLKHQVDKAEHRRQTLANSLGVKKELFDENEKETALTEREQALLDGTYTFLSDEYAALLFLLHLNVSTPLDLWYPIDATNGAKLIFDTFDTIAQIYEGFSARTACLAIKKASVKNIDGVSSICTENLSETSDQKESVQGESPQARQSPPTLLSLSEPSANKPSYHLVYPIAFFPSNPTHVDLSNMDTKSITDQILGLIQQARTAGIKKYSSTINKVLHCEIRIDTKITTIHQKEDPESAKKDDEQIEKVISSLLDKMKEDIVQDPEITVDYENYSLTLSLSTTVTKLTYLMQPK